MTADNYARYSQWKRWDQTKFMACDPFQRLYYEGELKGLDIAGLKIIELGFGNGSFLRFAKDKGADVSGTELLPEAKAGAIEHGIHVYEADLSDALFEDAGNFDLIVALDVMEHLSFDQLLTLFDILAALLKPGGHVLARFPNGQSPLGCVSQNGDHTHRSVLSAHLLMQMLTGKPWVMVRAGNPFMVLQADTFPKRMGLRLRHAARRCVEWTVNRLYGLDVTLDPNVTVMLECIRGPAEFSLGRPENA